MTHRTSRTALVILLLLVSLGALLRAAFGYRSVEWLTNYWLFEDFGYSLAIARNIAAGVGETFDGVVGTSGYQPLYVWLMVPVFWVTKEAVAAPIYAAVTLLALANLATSLFLYGIVRRMTGRVEFALLAAGLWLLNLAVARTGSLGLEAGLSTMTVSWAVWYFLGLDLTKSEPGKWMRLGAILGVCFLARVDGVFMIASVFAACCLLKRSQPKQLLAMLMIVGLSAAVFIVPYAAWNMAHYGSPLPTSGQVTTGKSSLFNLMTGEGLPEKASSVIYGLYIVGRVFLGYTTVNGYVYPPHAHERMLGWALLILLPILLLLASRAVRHNVAGRRGCLVSAMAMLAYLFGYTVYSFVAYERYFLPVVFFSDILIVCALFGLTRLTADSTIRLVAAGAGVISTVVFFHSAEMHLQGNFPRAFGWKPGIDKLNTIAAPGDPVAALQAGNLGYFYKQGRAVNLDGVVNMDAYRARKAGALASYLESQNVKYLADEGGWVFKVGQDIGDPQKRASYIARLEQRHASNDYDFNIYELLPAGTYSRVEKLAAQPGWARRENPMMVDGWAWFSSEPGRRLSFSAVGCVDLKMLRHDWSGVVRIYRDGHYLRDVDLYSRVADPSFRIELGDQDARHEYTLEVAGEKNANSSDRQVWIDAVLWRPRCSVPADRK